MAAAGSYAAAEQAADALRTRAHRSRHAESPAGTLPGGPLLSAEGTGSLELLLAAGEIVQLLEVLDVHGAALRQLDQTHHPQLGERAAHGLDGETQEVGDVGPRHRQVERIGIARVALVAAREGEQEGHDALRGA